MPKHNIRGVITMIVITGATGQVGTVLVKTLAERQEKVRAIVTEHDDLTPLKNYDIEIVEGDVRDREFLIE